MSLHAGERTMCDGRVDRLEGEALARRPTMARAGAVA
jgi:hypothetical protein